MPTENQGHGTHVSATIGGKIYGVAKKVDIYGVKVLGDNGSGSTSGVIAVKDSFPWLVNPIANIPRDSVGLPSMPIMTE